MRMQTPEQYATDVESAKEIVMEHLDGLTLTDWKDLLNERPGIRYELKMAKIFLSRSQQRCVIKEVKACLRKDR